jgi:HK97 family phage major capsid protein
MRVPLVWQHQHDSPANILGYAILEHRDQGVYAHAFFNDTENGLIAKKLVHSKNITQLSIYANKLTMRGGDVMHGDIKEVSLVMAGANPGALIESISLMHGDDAVDGEAIIFTGLNFDSGVISHGDTAEEEENVDPVTETVEHAAEEEESFEDVIESMTPKQQTVLHALVGEASLKAEPEDPEAAAAKHTQLVEEVSAGVIKHFKEDKDLMNRNIFTADAEGETLEHGSLAAPERKHLTLDQIQTILKDGERLGSLSDSVIAHADEYGITNIELLFPDAKNVSDMPELLARQTEWVAKVLNATKHSPFAKVKTIVADLTAAEARAKGYIKGTMKTEEVISLLRRTTGPTTIYKKQKLDRDDILDITDFDVVTWLKWEIRFMLNEEIARAILIGDGRSGGNPDKIKDPVGAQDGIGVRSIANDHAMYAHPIQVPTNTDNRQLIKEITKSRRFYRGSGSPTLYTSDAVITDLLLLEDKMGRRLYGTEAELASALRVKEIVAVEVFEEQPSLVGIVVNLTDYTVGANKGGELSFFEDFDIDFNQYKYLMETRISGGLTKPKAAIVIRRNLGTQVTPTAPSFNGSTNVLTITATTGVDYYVNDELTAAGNVTITEDVEVRAEAEAGYFIPNGTTADWYFSFSEI